MATIYDFKPQFQKLLRPIAAALAARGLSANDVTRGALVLSAAQGAWLVLAPSSRWPLLIVPVTLFLRMAFNVIDGLMAKEHGQVTKAGAVLNEASDVVADAAVYLPFALIPGLNAPLVVLSAAISAMRQRPAVPRKTVKNTGFSTATLIDCIAAMPPAGGRRPSAVITKVEKTKNRPPIRPEPSAERNVTTDSRRSIKGSRCAKRQSTLTSSQKPKRSATWRIEGRGAS